MITIKLSKSGCDVSAHMFHLNQRIATAIVCNGINNNC